MLVGLQVPGGSGDASRDVADALERVLDAEPGTPDRRRPRCPGPARGCRTWSIRRLPLDVEMQQRVRLLAGRAEERSAEVAESMERANEAVVPTVRLSSVEAAYWCDIRGRRHLRWVLPARRGARCWTRWPGCAAADQDWMGAGCRYVGSFRADGLVVPVWDLAAGT